VLEIAAKLSDDVLNALLLGLTIQNAPGQAQQLARLLAVRKAGEALLDALDLPATLPLLEAIRPPPIELRQLLQPGISDLPLISWPADLISLAGGMRKIDEARADHESLYRASGITPDESAGEVNRATDRQIVDAVVARLPFFAAIVRDVAAFAASSLAQPPVGRREDHTARLVFREMAIAHKAFFGFGPRLRNTEKERDTPSVRWVSQVLQLTEPHMQRLTKPARSDDQKVDWPDSPESQAFFRLANLSLDTISDRLGEARKQDTGGDA